MWVRNSFLLLGIFLVACQANLESVEPVSSPAGRTPSPAPTPQLEDDLQQLADEFRSLRATPGHFGGRTPNADVDQWQGRKHQLLLELGSRLGNGAYSQAQLVDLLGPADHIVTAGDPLMQNIVSLPNYNAYAAGDTFLVYEWRGAHDFLFFALQDDHVIGSDWWYAYE